MSGSQYKSPAVVSIIKAESYDYDKVYKAVKKCLELISGLDKIIKQGDKVFVKINHLLASPTEKGIVTHPVFLQAVLDLLKMTGADITVGDDIESSSGDGFLVSGIRQVCEKMGVRLTNLREGGFIETKCNGLLLDKIYLSRIALEADLIVNLPRLKTHSLTVFTGGVKNMYGTIPTGHRTKFHRDFMNVEDFCQMLVDVFSSIKPRLTIMDGIMAMEGEGPASGTMRNLGVVLASQDAVALDAVATRIIGTDPLSILTTRYASERGLGVGNLVDINTVGESINDVAVNDYKLPAAAFNKISSKVPPFLYKFLKSQMVIKPRVKKDSCTGCFECVRICPAGAALKNGEIATIKQSDCIHCLCCNEVCRFNAILLKRTWMGDTIGFVVHFLRKLT